MKAKHPEIKIDEKDIRIYNALSQKLNDITKLWNEEEYKEENEKMNSQPTENYDIISVESRAEAAYLVWGGMNHGHAAKAELGGTDCRERARSVDSYYSGYRFD